MAKSKVKVKEAPGSVDLGKFDPATIAKQELTHHLQSFIGQKIAFLCARYQYRGILSGIGVDFVVLANATSVEISGASTNEQPQTEDPIQSSIIVKLDAVELISQPNWARAPLPNEDGYNTRPNNR